MALADKLLESIIYNGLYVSAKPDQASVDQLMSWATSTLTGFDLTSPDKLHSTILYAKSYVVEHEVADRTHQLALAAVPIIRGYIERIEYWDGHDKEGYTVAKVTSPDLEKLHKIWIDSGAIHSFEDYTPHITLSTGSRDAYDNLAEIDVKLMNLKLRRNPIDISFLAPTFEQIKQ